MTANWTVFISPGRWGRLRRELEENQLVIPFTSGVARNRKTGYILTNQYNTGTSILILAIAYPEDVSPGQLETFLNNLTGCRGTLDIV